MKRNNLYATVCCALLVTSCAQVELNERINQSQYAGLETSFEWGAYQKPESVYLILNRIINTHRYVQEIILDEGTTPDVPATRTSLDTSEATPGEENNDGQIVDGKLQIKGGEYFMLAVSKPEEGVEITRFDEFTTNTAISINDLKINVNTKELHEIPELAGSSEGDFIKWMDFNLNYKYIKNIAPIYTDLQKNIAVKTGDNLKVTFAPKPLTQEIKIPFKVVIEEGVEITNVLAEISGVVKEVNAVTCQFDSSSIHRIIFAPKLESRNNQTLSYEGVIHVLGLFPNNRPGNFIGPGILHLAIYAEADGKKRIFHTAKNLYNEISQAKLINYLPKEKKFELARESATLATDYVFKITVEQITADYENGIDIWKECENDIEGEL